MILSELKTWQKLIRWFKREKKILPEHFRSYKYVRWMRSRGAHNLEKELEQTRICKYFFFPLESKFFSDKITRVPPQVGDPAD